MITVEKTGKTVEEAVASALKELQVTENDVTVEVLEQPKSGFLGLIGGRPAKVAVTLIKKEEPKEEETITVETEEAMPVVGEDPIAVGKAFLMDVFAKMNLTVAIEAEEKEEVVLFDLKGNDLGILIGRHGQTLDALQYLTNLAANKHAGEGRKRIVLDVEDYRKRREETLVRLAQRLANKVKRRNQRIVLEPMSRHERKIIHMALQDDPQIATYSEGEEPYRKIVIAVKR
ncbi:MAG: protein jag [Selenomonadales bacterium]|jgi:spoIIIJ-associated protein|nr:protein jag [Selenomonadales bacterium]MBQ5636399.1 protein jag [Selenomonadales bacterium]MBQ5746194.1 protein jag [Selenomonadales bacterium]MBQ5832724.1 protein jag [Selenomonadales bacterium]MBQ5860374.1 protein jag [Selenomonadales bacterium]